MSDYRCLFVQCPSCNRRVQVALSGQGGNVLCPHEDCRGPIVVAFADDGTSDCATGSDPSGSERANEQPRATDSTSPVTGNGSGTNGSSTTPTTKKRLRAKVAAIGGLAVVAAILLVAVGFALGRSRAQDVSSKNSDADARRDDDRTKKAVESVKKAAEKLAERRRQSTEKPPPQPPYEKSKPSYEQRDEKPKPSYERPSPTPPSSRLCTRCSGSGSITSQCSTCSSTGKKYCGFTAPRKTYWTLTGTAFKQDRCVNGRFAEEQHGYVSDGEIYNCLDVDHGVCYNCNGTSYVTCAACRGQAVIRSTCSACQGRGRLSGP